VTITSEYLPLTFTSGYLFPFTFPVLDTDHIVVTFIDTDGDETLLVEGTNYEITGWSRPGDTGNVRRHAAGDSGTDLPLGAGEELRVSRDVPYTQPTDLVNEVQFFQESIEQGIDRVAMQAQQLSEQMSRTIRMPEAEAGTAVTELPLAADRAGQTFIFDALGQPSVGSVTSITIPAAPSDANVVLDGSLNWSSVGSGKIDALAVTTAKIDALAVTAAKIAADAVTTAKILDANVTTAKILDRNVTLQKLGISTNFVSVTGALTATADRLHVISGTSADYTISLPTGTTGNLFWFYVLDSASANKVYTLDPTFVGQTIDGAATLALTAGDSVLLIQDGVNYRTLAKSVANTTTSTTQKLTGSGTFTAVNGATYEATLVGGGGGGGSGACGTTSNHANGGQGGLTSQATVVFVASGTSLSYSCGSGGAGGTAVGSSAANGRYGSNGGNTTLDTFTIRGGQGGQGGLDMTINTHTATSGQGIGGAAAAGSTGASGSNATADWGGGGGGGAGHESGNNSGAGGNGAAGYILIRRIA